MPMLMPARSGLVVTPNCPVFYFFAKGVEGLPMPMRPDPPVPMPMPVRPWVAASGYLLLPLPFCLKSGGALGWWLLLSAPPHFLFSAYRAGRAYPCSCALSWVGGHPLPLFSLSFSWKEGGGLGWLPHPPFCPLTTDPMVERAERQAFAPKVAGSSPTGALCERRGEKTLSGLFILSPPKPTVSPRSSS